MTSIDRSEPSLDALYRDVILDHYRTPRGRDPIPEPTVVNEGTNPLCGDEVTVAAKLGAGNIERVHVHGRGCSISTASGSMMAEVLRGKSGEQAKATIAAFKRLMHGETWPAHLDEGDLDALEGVAKFPVRIKCALLPWTTLEDALAAHERGAKTDRPSTTEQGGAGS